MQFNPRLSGIYEHQERAHFLCTLTIETSEDTARYRLLMAALYSCRAIVEIMLESAKEQELQSFRNANGQESRKALESCIRPNFPYYSLIERIRIHDFHRFGLPPSNHDLHETFVGGRIKLTAQGGAASLTVAHGLEVTATGRSKVELQRPLIRSDEKFFDDETAKFVSLDEILTSFLAAAPEAIRNFELHYDVQSPT